MMTFALVLQQINGRTEIKTSAHMMSMPPALFMFIFFITQNIDLVCYVGGDDSNFS